MNFLIGTQAQTWHTLFSLRFFARKKRMGVFGEKTGIKFLFGKFSPNSLKNSSHNFPQVFLKFHPQILSLLFSLLKKHPIFPFPKNTVTNFYHPQNPHKFPDPSNFITVLHPQLV
jgi:hypothetical protein